MESAAVSPQERWWPWLEGGCLALLVLIVLLVGGETVRASYHGLLHTTVGEAVMRDGLLPENPYHAGTPLRYYVLYPAMGVLFGRLGAGPLWGFAFLNLLAACLFAPALDSLGRSLGLGGRARRMAFLFAVFGFNALGSIGYLISTPQMGHAPVYVLGSLCFQDYGWGWDARLQSFLPKFLNVSSFALALPFGLWALSAIAANRPRHFFLPAGLALAINPLVGGFAGVCAALLRVSELWTQKGADRWQWPLCGGLAVALAVPFLLPIFQAGPEGESLIGELTIRGNFLTNLIGPLLLMLLPSLLGARSLSKEARFFWGLSAGLAALLVLIGSMPWGNEYKMARLGGILWALPAGVWLSQKAEQTPWLSWTFILAGVPTTILTILAYTSWGKAAAPLPVKVESGRLSVNAEVVRPAFSKAYLEAEAAVGPEGVVVIHPAHPGAAIAGGLVQGNAFAGVFQHPLAVDAPHVHNDHQEELLARLDALFGLYQGQSTPQQICGKPVRAIPREEGFRQLQALLPDRILLIMTFVQDAPTNEMLKERAEILTQDDFFILWRSKS